MSDSDLALDSDSASQAVVEFWYALDLTVSPASEEIITWALWSIEPTGIEIIDETPDAVKLCAYFELAPDLEASRMMLNEALLGAYLSTELLQSLTLRRVPNEDWLKKWKEGYEPFTVGQRFIIVPSWKQVEPDQLVGRLKIELDPGMAFGTGTHETTRLCLQAIERHWRGGRFLDVGTGTGILALGAALLQPESYIEGCDIDPNAVNVARENAQINGLGEKIVFRAATIAAYQNQFDMVVANLTIDLLAPQLSSLAGVVGPDGRLILSGVLAGQVSQLRSVFAETGLAELELESMGEWVALTCAKS